MSMAGGDDNRWQSTMNNANSVQIIGEDLCPWQVANQWESTCNTSTLAKLSLKIYDRGGRWWQSMTIDDNQLWIMPTLSKSSEKIYVHGRWLWQSTGNNFNCGKIVGENLCPWQAVMTIDDNQLWITPTLSKSSEKIYVHGRWLWQSTGNNFNCGKIVGENLCPWRAVTTIDDNQQWITPTLGNRWKYPM